MIIEQRIGKCGSFLKGPRHTTEKCIRGSRPLGPEKKANTVFKFQYKVYQSNILNIKYYAVLSVANISMGCENRAVWQVNADIAN